MILPSKLESFINYDFSKLQTRKIITHKRVEFFLAKSIETHFRYHIVAIKKFWHSQVKDKWGLMPLNVPNYANLIFFFNFALAKTTSTLKYNF